jgi:hypothetical protein
MDTFKNIPKPVLVLLILTIAAVVILLGDPPKDACDAQLEVFSETQAGRLSSLRGTVGSLWARTAKYCNDTKTLGGCAEFYETVRFAIRDIQIATYDCVPRLLSEEWIQKTLIDSMTLMVKLAWGENVPELGPSMYGWHRPIELVVFCNLKNLIRRSLSDEEWEAYVRKTIHKLPHSSELNFNDGFGRSLFSVRCEALQ